MKKTIIISAALLILVVLPVCAQTTFNGTWKINKEKTTLPAEMLYLSQITMKVEGEKLITTRTYTNADAQEYPFDEVITLDGKECKSVIYDMPRVTTAKKGTDGTIVIISKTTFNGDSGQEDLIANESWKTADQGKTLVCDFTNKMMGQEMKMVFHYDKVN
jgi:hypothetical protein